MPVITIFFGLVLFCLSLATVFFRVGSLSEIFADLGESFKPGTWLIPAGFGFVLILLGVLSKLKACRSKTFYACGCNGGDNRHPTVLGPRYQPTEKARE
jgi:hypothetical protein